MKKDENLKKLISFFMILPLEKCHAKVKMGPKQ